MKPDFNKGNGLVPVIIQDAQTLRVLMLGYMNEEAYEQTQSTGRVCFYSRSKQRLWVKGETSGNFLNVAHIALDCDNDTLLITVKPDGPACHKGTTSCFRDNATSVLAELSATIRERRQNPKEGSYTNLLLEKGINKVAQKVGEEAVELVIEAKDDNKELFLNEAADLMYHYLVLLEAKGFTLSQVEEVLKSRR